MKEKRSIGTIFLYLFCAMILVIFLFITVDGANKASKVIRAGDNAVTLKATLSNYEERTEIDEGYESTRYDTYVSYDYDGEHYSNVRYGSSLRKPKLGKTVTVKIDPAHPGELLSSDGELGLSAIMSCIFLAGIGMLAYCALRDWLIGRAEKQEYDRDTARQKAKTHAYVLVAAVMAAAGGLYYHAVGTWVYMAFNAIALLLMSLMLYIMLKKSKAKES